MKEERGSITMVVHTQDNIIAHTLLMKRISILDITSAEGVTTIGMVEMSIITIERSQRRTSLKSHASSASTLDIMLMNVQRRNIPLIMVTEVA
jgi:hypothetical protein